MLSGIVGRWNLAWRSPSPYATWQPVTPSNQLEFNWRTVHNTISKFIPEVCDAIVEEYAPEVFRTPTTTDGWLEIAKGFQDKWNFPHVCGAIDGKHVAIRKQKQSGSIYYNYKGFFSIVILVLCDANYKAIWAHVGSPGSESDCGIYNDSPMFQGIQDETIKLPPPEPLPNDTEDTPYFFIGDDAFTLRQHMLKPFSARYLENEQLVFNNRLSRARRVVENLFGILGSPIPMPLTHSRGDTRESCLSHQGMSHLAQSLPWSLWRE